MSQTPKDRTRLAPASHDAHEQHQPARVGQPCAHCEPWQLTDGKRPVSLCQPHLLTPAAGCIYALRELCQRAPEAALELIPLFARVVSAVCVRACV